MRGIYDFYLLLDQLYRLCLVFARNSNRQPRPAWTGTGKGVKASLRNARRTRCDVRCSARVVLNKEARVAKRSIDVLSKNMTMPYYLGS